MRALAVTTTNLDAAGLMTNDVFAEYNMLADRAASKAANQEVVTKRPEIEHQAIGRRMPQSQGDCDAPGNKAQLCGDEPRNNTGPIIIVRTARRAFG